MKRLCGVSAIILLLITGIFNAAASGESKITAEFLTGTKWGPEHQGGRSFTFNADGTFTGWEDFIQDGRELKGRYEIRDGRLSLFTQQNLPMLTLGALKEDNESLIYSAYIRFKEGDSIWDKNSMVKIDKPVKVDGIPSVTMGRKNGKALQNIKFRKKPLQSAAELQFIILAEKGEGPVEDKLSYIPSGTAVFILARTASKEKVQKWEDYWYYIEVEEPYDRWKKGWVFAKFIQPE